MISLGMPSGPGALPVPSELTVLSKVLRFVMSARVTEGSPRGAITNCLGLSGVSHGRRGRSGGVARASSLSKWVWTAVMTSLGESTIFASWRVIVCRAEVVLLSGMRPLLY
jgi:hypothetical protein